VPTLTEGASVVDGWQAWHRATAALPAALRARAERASHVYLAAIPGSVDPTPARVRAALAALPRWFTSGDVRAALAPLGLELRTGKPRWTVAGAHDVQPFNTVSLVGADGKVYATAEGTDTADAFRRLQRDPAAVWVP
jgi:hypothetical protein